MKGEEAEVQSVENKQRLFPYSVVTCGESLSCAWLETGLFQIHLLSALLLSVYILNTFALSSFLLNKTDL